MPRRRLIPLFVATALGAVTVLAAVEGARTDRQLSAVAAENVLTQTSQAVESLGTTAEGRVTDVAALFAASGQVRASDFAAFTAPMISDSGASSYSWVQLVSDAERPAYERLTGHEIFEMRSGRTVTAAHRARYAVTTYAASASGTQATVGFDVLGDPQQADAVKRALATSAPQSTGAVTFDGRAHAGFVLYLPVYAQGHGPALGGKPVGLVAGAFPFSALQSELAPLVPKGAATQIRINDDLAISTGSMGDRPVHAVVAVAGQHWRVAATPQRPDRALLGLSRCAAALLSLGLLTLLVTGITSQAMAGARRTEELAALRESERDRAIQEKETSERATQELLAHLPDLAVMRYDEDLRIVNAGGGLLGRAGWATGEMDGATVHALFGERADELEDPMRRALAGEASSLPFASVRVSDMRYWLQTLPLMGPEPGGLLVASDVTALLSAEGARDSAEQRFERAFIDAPFGMALLRPDGTLTRVNDALCRMAGRSARDLESSGWSVLADPADMGAMDTALRSLNLGETTTVALELRLRRPSGQRLWAAVHATQLPDASGQCESVLVQAIDVTDRRDFEERLRHLADTDSLTGLLNRRSFEQALSNQVALALRYGGEGALLMIDLDHFKSVNDTLGHPAGDDVLRAVSDILRVSLRTTDVIGRLGGDEFAVLLPKADREAALHVADKLCEAIRRCGAERHRGAAGSSVTASIGCVLLSDVPVSAEDFIARADRALYETKARGRDGSTVAAASTVRTRGGRA